MRRKYNCIKISMHKETWSSFLFIFAAENSRICEYRVRLQFRREGFINPVPGSFWVKCSQNVWLVREKYVFLHPCGMGINKLKKELKNKHYGGNRIYYCGDNWCNYHVSA